MEPDTQETVDAGVEPDTQETVDAGDNFPICQPEVARVLGGFGPSRICDLPGGLAISMMEEGFALQAAGGESGCRIVSDQNFIEELVEIMASWIEAQDLAVPGLVDIAEGQPLRLKLLRAILQAAEDHFLVQAETGLPVRILEPLPRTPHVFEPQEKWPLENSPWEPALAWAWVPNYGSTREHLDFAKEKFQEEIEEGLMEKMSPDTFRERENTAIAALAVIVEDEEKGKKRLIHDATHGVRVNHRIKCRDKLRAPGARDKKQLLLEAMDRKEVPFSIVGDIKKAHRRFKHLAKEHGFLACQLDSPDGPEGQLDESCVYINKVGTFGVNCASYWWTRIAACGIRATHHLLGRCPRDLLLYADDLESVATTKRGRIAIVLSYCYLTAFGYPFKWSKTTKRYRVEWLGMETEYSSYRLGLTEKRATWLVTWLRDKVRAGKVTAKEMAQGLGRLGFAAISLAFPRAALRLVICYSGTPGPDDDTHHA